MRERLEVIRQEALTALHGCRDEAALEGLRIRFLGKKGELTALLRGMRDVPPEDRRAIGELVNAVRGEVESSVDVVQARLEQARLAASLEGEQIDVTLPGARWPRGHVHPITQVMDEALAIFTRMGFSIAEGPDIEDDYHNFEALNIPKDHPARDMQDTFFVEGDRVLRTHTSPVQIRVMESVKPPLRVIAPGAAYRQDGDATHSPMFHQIEGFLVDRNVTFADLRGVLAEFWRGLFGSGTRVRFRPSFFPFTEPSAEVDVTCFLCLGSGEVADGAVCRLCKRTGWLEIGGSGMIDPNVFRSVGYDPEEYSGFAFGLGVERIAMLRYQIGDIRLFFENDLRFLRQF